MENNLFKQCYSTPIDIHSSGINYASNIIICPKCKRKFHKDNFLGHRKYEIEMENQDNLINIGIGNEEDLILKKNKSIGVAYMSEDILSKNSKKLGPIMITKPLDNSINIAGDKSLESEIFKSIKSQVEVSLSGLDYDQIKNLKNNLQIVNDEIVAQNIKCENCENLLKIGDEIITIPKCSHNFHKDHILQWLENNKVCYKCNGDIFN